MLASDLIGCSRIPLNRCKLLPEFSNEDNAVVKDSFQLRIQLIPDEIVDFYYMVFNFTFSSEFIVKCLTYLLHFEFFVDFISPFVSQTVLDIFFVLN